MRKMGSSFVIALLVIAAGCASAAPRAEVAAAYPELSAFALELERSLEAHDWQAIISAADPDHYRVQVTEGGMGEPQYIAELFRLHHVDNDIKRGETVSWADLERIEAVSLHRIDPGGDRIRIVGEVRLTDGGTLDLEAQAFPAADGYRLTGSVG